MTILAGLALATLSVHAGARDRVLVAAHRGGAALWPENSLLAFRQALALGVDFLEADVHLTSDGEVVVLHDPTLERTTTGAGAVRDTSLAALARVRLKAADGTPTDEPVPTLAQLLDLIRPASVELLLEIKVGVDRQRYPGIEEKALALVRSRELAGRSIVMAFEAETIRRVRQLDPGIRTAYVVGRGQVERRRVAAVEAVGWARDLGVTHLGIDQRVLDAAVVTASTAAGMHVAAWTVNEETDIRRVVDLGVGTVISDRPDLVKRVIGR